MQQTPPASPTQVLHLSGTDREIGKAHADQTGTSAKEGMLKFYYGLFNRLSQPPTDDWRTRASFKSVRFLLEKVVRDRLLRQVPPFALERIEGFVEGSGLDRDLMLTTLVLPDLLPILQASSSRWIPGQFVPFQTPGVFGCSSFVSNGRFFLVGRNLDFPGVGYWDRFPVIQLTKRSGALAFIGVTSAGVPIGGITGINEAQITLSLHQHYSRRVSLRGTLPYVIGEDVLSRAKSIPEALEILRSYRVAASWAFVVSDGKTLEAAIYETDAQESGTRWLDPADPVMAHSNFFQCGDCGVAEYSASARMNWDNYSRKVRLEALIRRAGFELTPAQALKAISDHYDPYWESEKIINRTVSQVYNIQSLLWDPENMRLYLAEGDSPVQIRQYREYDLGEIFAGREGKTENLYEGYRFQSESKRTSKVRFISSFISAMDGDLNSARDSIRESLMADFCPEAGLTAAILSLKVGQYATAEKILHKALALIEKWAREKEKTKMPPEYYEILLFLGRTYDLLNQRANAKRFYREAAQSEDWHLVRLAMKDHPYSENSLRRIVTPYSTYVPLQ